MNINKERLAEHFTTLCELSSPSGDEKAVADYLKQTFSSLGADFIREDESSAQTGSNSGNLIIRFNGSNEVNPIFFACHMDTVNPGRDVKVDRNGDILTSRGETILGGDDKSGIAPLIELVTLLKENGPAHRTIEIVFTTCEEIGLLGARHLDYRLLQSRFGYALDSTGIDQVIIGAPAANKIKISVHGIAAHAGINPEAGINAFLIAAHAITKLRLGRIDEESTANLGLIKGGVATNIVPEHLVLDGEVRSHSAEKLAAYTEEIKSTFINTIADWPSPAGSVDRHPSLDFTVSSAYPAMHLSMDDIVVQTVKKAGQKLGRELQFIIAGGGSDANFLNGYGLATAIIATGMTDVHTTNESLDLNDMVSLTELLYAIATE